MDNSQLIGIISTISGGSTAILAGINTLIKTFRTRPKKSVTSQMIQNETNLALAKLKYQKKVERIELISDYQKKQAKLEYEEKTAWHDLKNQALIKQANYQKEKSQLEVGLTPSLPNLTNLKSQGENLVKSGLKEAKDKLGNNINSLLDFTKKTKKENE
jgi:hypothetical protein